MRGAHVRGAVLLPVRGGNGVPWSSASEAGLGAVAFERAVALGAADLREKNKCSIRVLTAKSLEINCCGREIAFRWAWRVKECLRVSAKVCSR